MARSDDIPLVALDVDGVVFPQMRHDPALVGCRLRVAGFPVFLTSVVAERLAQVTDEARLVWLTSWESDAPEAIGPLLGMQRAPFLPLRACTIAEKQERLVEVCGDAPLVWADDKLGAAARRFAASRSAPTLLIKPAPARGLTARQLDRIGAFVAEHSPTGG